MRKPPLKPDAQGQTGTKLLVAVIGKASAAKAAEGDEPVFAYIASLPQPRRSIAERVDALAANTLPNLQRAVKWGMAYYGVGGGWCFSSGAFVGHVKLMFIRGTEIKPETACDADWDGQVHTRRRSGIRGRSRRAPSSLVDEAGSREPLCRGEETMTKMEDIRRGQFGRCRTNDHRPRGRQCPPCHFAV
jgi:hypothetical protein